MNSASPYQSPETTSETRSWLLIDWVVVGLWVVIPGGVFVGQKLLPSVLEEFGAELPIATQFLLQFYTPYLLAIVAFVVFLAMFTIPHGTTRRRFMWFACISGVLTGVACLLSILGPLFSVVQGLG